jgi:hypothetical protein
MIVRKLSGLLLIPIAFSGCSLPSFPGTDGVVLSFTNQSLDVVGKPPAFSTVQLLTGALTPDEKTKAVSAKFFVGSKTFAGKATEQFGASQFQYTTTNPCQDLPQGKDIPARYEIYDAAQIVIQTKSVVFTIISTC